MNRGHLFFWGAFFVLSGCVSSSEPVPPGFSLQEIAFFSEENVNMNTAVSVDLVVVYEKQLWEKIKNMNSLTYFSAVDQVHRDNPTALEIWRWEMVPRQFSGYCAIRAARPQEAWGAVLFADYQTPGIHRLHLEDVPRVKIILGPQDMQSPEISSVQEGQTQKKTLHFPDDVPFNTWPQERITPDFEATQMLQQSSTSKP